MHPEVHVDKFFNKLWLKGSWSDSPPPFKQFTGKMRVSSRRGDFQRSHVIEQGPGQPLGWEVEKKWGQWEAQVPTCPSRQRCHSVLLFTLLLGVDKKKSMELYVCFVFQAYERVSLSHYKLSNLKAQCFLPVTILTPSFRAQTNQNGSNDTDIHQLVCQFIKVLHQMRRKDNIHCNQTKSHYRRRK